MISVFFVQIVHGATYFVDTNGNDSTGNGIQTKPWRTIKHALKNVQSGDTLSINDGTYNDEEVLYSILLSYGRIDGSFDFKRFLKLTVKAINNELQEFKDDTFMKDFDWLMEQLKVLPYNENMLPQEQPITL